MRFRDRANISLIYFNKFENNRLAMRKRQKGYTYNWKDKAILRDIRNKHN